VKVTSGWIEPIIGFMQKNANVAAVQPKIMSLTEPERFEYAGAAGGFIDKWGYPFARGRVFNVTEKDHGQYDDTAAVFWASGAAMFIRAKDFFARWGGEEFILLLEDTSLEHAIGITEHLRKIVEKHDFEIDQTITCSFGLVSAKEGVGAEQLFHKADNALYQAKASYLSIKLAEHASASSKKNLALIKSVYDQGNIGIIELLDAQHTALRAALIENNTRYNFMRDLLVLQHNIGQVNFDLNDQEWNQWLSSLTKYSKEKE